MRGRKNKKPLSLVSVTEHDTFIGFMVLNGSFLSCESHFIYISRGCIKPKKVILTPKCEPPSQVQRKQHSADQELYIGHLLTSTANFTKLKRLQGCVSASSQQCDLGRNSRNWQAAPDQRSSKQCLAMHAAICPAPSCSSVARRVIHQMLSPYPLLSLLLDCLRQEPAFTLISNISVCIRNLSTEHTFFLFLQSI